MVTFLYFVIMCLINFTATDGDKEHEEESDSNEDGNYTTFVCTQFSC